MTKLVIAAALVATSVAATAETYTDGGIDWSYDSVGDTIRIYSTSGKREAAISTSTSGDIVIPGTIGGTNVTILGEYSFYDCKEITGATIPNTVTNINDSAFGTCYALKSITIPDSVTDIGDSAFGECKSLASAVLSQNLKSVGMMAFMNCNSLTDIVIPNSVTNLGIYAFSGTGVTNLTIGTGLEEIGSGAFNYCTNLASVTIPSNVRSIADSAFWGCESLSEVVIPDTVTNIASYAFQDTGLKSVSIPAGCTYDMSTEDASFPAGCIVTTRSVTPTAISIIGITLEGHTVTLKTDYTGESASVVSATTLAGFESGATTNDNCTVTSGAITLEGQTDPCRFYKVFVK